jgi:hypothetical protein
MSVCLSVYLSVLLSDCLSVCLSVPLSILSYIYIMCQLFIVMSTNMYIIVLTQEQQCDERGNLLICDECRNGLAVGVMSAVVAAADIIFRSA